MPRKRERFDRTDVPRDSPYRNVIGAVVCVLVLCATALVVYTVWNRVKLESRLGDVDLSQAVDSQGMTSVADGYVASPDDIEAILLLTADTLDEKGVSLQGARVLAVNKTQGTVAMASIPLDSKMVSDDEPVTLADLYASSGSAGTVGPLAEACGLTFDHVVVATSDVLEEVSKLSGSDTASLMRSASDLLSKLKTDLDPAGLLSLAETLSKVGVENLTQFDAITSPETAQGEDGSTTETGWQVIDKTQLGVSLGTLVSGA